MTELKLSLDWWEWVEYITVIGVIVGVAGEYVHSFCSWAKNKPWSERFGQASVLLLIGSLALELVALVKVNSLSGEVIAVLEREGAGLRLELDREVQKRAPRVLTEEQKSIIVRELQGRLKTIEVAVQNDVETEAFAGALMDLFKKAGISVSVVEASPPDARFPRIGVLMHSPNGGTEIALQNDPLYVALKKAGLFGGLASRYGFGKLKGPLPAIVSGSVGHIVYVGQKSTL